MTIYENSHQFSWLKALRYGLLLWLVMFCLAAALAGLNISITSGIVLILAIVAGTLSFMFSKNLDPAGVFQALGYGGFWLAIGLTLDSTLSFRLVPELFGFWTYWLGYCFILLAPWLETIIYRTPRMMYR